MPIWRHSSCSPVAFLSIRVASLANVPTILLCYSPAFPLLNIFFGLLGYFDFCYDSFPPQSWPSFLRWHFVWSSCCTASKLLLLFLHSNLVVFFRILEICLVRSRSFLFIALLPEGSLDGRKQEIKAPSTNPKCQAGCPHAMATIHHTQWPLSPLSPWPLRKPAHKHPGKPRC